jgi:protein involved in polysaccharide export with SLBB domain
MMKYHKKFRSLTVTVRSSEPGYDEIPQKVQDTVTVTIARKPGYDEIPQKVQVIVTLSVALNPSMVKYHKKFRSL